MRYMLMFKPDVAPAPGELPCKQHLPAMATLMTDLKRKGIVLATEGLMPSDTGARVRFNGGRISVKDGPFAEAKELVAGFAIVNVKSRDEALDLAKQFLQIAGGGVSDVLEVHEPAV